METIDRNESECSRISPQLLERIEILTEKKPHHLLTRGFFFSHRDFERILDSYENGEPFFLYAKRSPSSVDLHLGHFLEFIFIKWLQEAFNVPLVIHIAVNEKFFKGEYSLEECVKYGIENCKDILAIGFNPDKTFLFSDYDYMGGAFYYNICKVQAGIKFNQLKEVFGICGSDNCGKTAYPAIQAAASFCNSFPHIFGNKTSFPCLIPQSIDQESLFRMTQDIAFELNYQKPACIYSTSFPSMLDLRNSNSAIFLTDSPKLIESKIKKYAFSGGGASIEEHRLNEANLTVDIPYKYLTFFLEDEQRLVDIRDGYAKGQVLTSEVKQFLILIVQRIIRDHQEKRARITSDKVYDYMR